MSEWSYNATTFAKLNLTTLRGEPGLGFYRLIAQVDVTTHSREEGEEVSVTNIRGADLMGHKDTRMTRRYAHIGPVHLASAVGKLEESYRAFYCTITVR